MILLAVLSAKLHLHQAEKLGEAKRQCDLDFAEYAFEKEIATQELLAKAREEARLEQIRLKAERDRQAETARALREQLNTTVSVMAEELDGRAAAQPEIVPWLDSPVPPSLQEP